MCRKSVVFVLVLCTVGVAQAAFTDDCNSVHNYMTAGANPYSGIVGSDTIKKLDVGISRPGSLYMETANSTWDAAQQGALIYLYYSGDFKATVKITDFAGTLAAPMFHNSAGIMARSAPTAGGSENWVSVNYFPTWTAFIAWNNVSNARAELGQTVGRWTGADTYSIAAQYPWLQLERKGSDFYPRISADGKTFIPLTDPAYQGIFNGTQKALVISRPDLPTNLQIGLQQCTYTADVGYAAFDNFSIVPEPATLALLGLGGLALIRRKRG